MTIGVPTTTTATFNLNRYLLRVTRTNGGGTVNFTPPNEIAGVGCTVLDQTYDHGTLVMLTAQADSNAGFMAAGVGPAQRANQNLVCQVPMDVAKEVTAAFLTLQALTVD